MNSVSGLANQTDPTSFHFSWIGWKPVGSVNEWNNCWIGWFGWVG